MPISACAQTLRDDPATGRQALQALLMEWRQQPLGQVRGEVAQTPVADLADVLLRASRLHGTDGRTLGTQLFEAIGPATVVGHLDGHPRTVAMVLDAARNSSPEVFNTVFDAARTRRIQGLTLLDHAHQSGDPRAQRAVDAMLQHRAALASRRGWHATAIAETAVERGYVRECHESLVRQPVAGDQHIRRFLQQIFSLPPGQRDRAMQDADPQMVIEILGTAARTMPTAGMPESTRPLVRDAFDALPSGFLLRTVTSHPELTMRAAAMANDVSTLGRVLDAALGGGEDVCRRVATAATQIPTAPIEVILRDGSAFHVADLLNTTSLGSPVIGASVLRRAAEHASDPVGRLLNSGAAHILALAAGRCGMNVQGIHQRRDEVRLREPATASRAPHFSDVGGPVPATGAAPHFTSVGGSAPPSAPRPPRQPSHQV